MNPISLGQPVRTWRPLIGVGVANMISALGNVFTIVAVPWFVLETTGSASRAGITGAVSALSFLAYLFGGALVDRFGFKRASVLADLSSGVIVALIPLLYFTIGLAFWQVLVLVFLRAVCNTPGVAARQGLLPETIALAGVQPERANGIYQTTLNGANLLGTAVAGVLIALVGAASMLWLDGLSFLVSAVLIGLVVPSRSQPSRRAAQKHQYWHDMAEGWRYLANDRLLMAITVSVIATNFVLAALETVILPVYARQVFGTSVALGLLSAGLSAGALIATLVYAVVGSHVPRRGTFVASLLVFGSVFWLLVPTFPLAFSVAAMALQGLALGPINPLFSTIEQERVPRALRGRVLGTILALAMVTNPLGSLFSGYSVSSIGLQRTLAAMGIGMLFIGIWTIKNRHLREMDRSIEDNSPVKTSE